MVWSIRALDGDGKPRLSVALIALAAVVVTGLFVWLRWRNASRAASGEQDYDVALICPRCGYVLHTTFATMHLLPPPESAGRRELGSPITTCPHCRQSGMVPGAACPRCGKSVLREAVMVDGKLVRPHCPAWGWEEERGRG